MERIEEGWEGPGPPDIPDAFADGLLTQPWRDNVDKAHLWEHHHVQCLAMLNAPFQHAMLGTGHDMALWCVQHRKHEQVSNTTEGVERAVGQVVEVAEGLQRDNEGQKRKLAQVQEESQATREKFQRQLDEMKEYWKRRERDYENQCKKNEEEVAQLRRQISSLEQQRDSLRQEVDRSRAHDRSRESILEEVRDVANDLNAQTRQNVELCCELSQDISRELLQHSTVQAVQPPQPASRVPQPASGTVDVEENVMRFSPLFEEARQCKSFLHLGRCFGLSKEQVAIIAAALANKDANAEAAGALASVRPEFRLPYSDLLFEFMEEGDRTALLYCCERVGNLMNLGAKQLFAPAPAPFDHKRIKIHWHKTQSPEPRRKVTVEMLASDMVHAVVSERDKNPGQSITLGRAKDEVAVTFYVLVDGVWVRMVDEAVCVQVHESEDEKSLPHYVTTFPGIASSSFFDGAHMGVLGWVYQQMCHCGQNPVFAKLMCRMDRVFISSNESSRKAFLENENGWWSEYTPIQTRWLKLVAGTLDESLVKLDLETRLVQNFTDAQKMIWNVIQDDDCYQILLAHMDQHFYAVMVVFVSSNLIKVVVCDGLNWCHHREFREEVIIKQIVLNIKNSLKLLADPDGKAQTDILHECYEQNTQNFQTWKRVSYRVVWKMGDSRRWETELHVEQMVLDTKQDTNDCLPFAVVVAAQMRAYARCARLSGHAVASFVKEGLSKHQRNFRRQAAEMRQLVAAFWRVLIGSETCQSLLDN